MMVILMGAIVYGLATTALDLLGTSLYDIGQVKRRKQFAALKNTRSFRKRLKISIVIPAFNEALVIERTLKSIIKSSYRTWEIIVVDDKSSDGTAAVVRTFAKKYPKQSIRVVSKRQNAGRGAAINTGVRYANGDLVMALDADSTLEKDALRNVVRHFMVEDKLAALASNVRIMKHPSVIGLMQRYEYLTSFRSKKLNTFLNAEYIIGGSGAVYRRSLFKKFGGMDEYMLTEDIAMSLKIASQGNREYLLQYASDVIVFTEPVPTYWGLFKQRYRWKLGSLQAIFAHKSLMFKRGKKYSKTLTWFRLPNVIWSEFLLLSEPIVYTYFMYLAIVLGNPILFVIGWAGVCMMLGFAIWGDDQLRLKEKIQFTFYIPVMYVLFYIITILQITAMFRCLMNLSKITGRTKIRGSWQSPKRLVTAE